MGLLDRLLGREDRSRQQQWGGPQGQQGYPQGQQGYQQGQQGYQQGGYQGQQNYQQGPGQQGRSDDEVAIERYRYMLRTAPPEQVEQAHAEAFARLTPQQRQQVLAELGNEVPPAERARSDSPQDLARMATRAEMRQPGTMERVLGRGGGGMGMGGMIAGGLLASVAGAFIGTAIADAMFDFNDSGEGVDGTEAAADTGDTGGDVGDAGGDYGGGSDFGGGDFGGDFGGGDFGGF